MIPGSTRSNAVGAAETVLKQPLRPTHDRKPGLGRTDRRKSAKTNTPRNFRRILKELRSLSPLLPTFRGGEK